MTIYSQLPIYRVAYDLLSVAVDLVQNMPRPFKAAIGGRLRDLCIDVVLLWDASPFVWAVTFEPVRDV